MAHRAPQPSVRPALIAPGLFAHSRRRKCRRSLRVGRAHQDQPMTAQPSDIERITVDPAICHGKPCIRGLRYPVETLLELLSSGMTFEEIQADYEDLERDD